MSLKQFFKGFRKGMKDFSENVSTIVNSVFLSIVYLIGVGITSIIAKVMKKRFLDTKISNDEKTYWTELNLKKKSFKKYYKQF